MEPMYAMGPDHAKTFFPRPNDCHAAALRNAAGTAEPSRSADRRAAVMPPDDERDIHVRFDTTRAASRVTARPDFPGPGPRRSKQVQGLPASRKSRVSAAVSFAPRRPTTRRPTPGRPLPSTARQDLAAV